MTLLRRIQVSLAALAAVAGLAWAQRMFPQDLPFSLVMVLPVGLAAAVAGTRVGIALGSVAALSSLSADAPGSLLLADFGLRFLVYASVSAAAARAYRSIGLERAKAHTDTLTGIANRRALLDGLERMLQDRRRRPVAVLLLDVDDFKTINDQRGHAEGDAALRSVAHALRSSIREGDLAARLGGDEFVVALGNADLPTARKVAERIRSSFHQLRPGLTLSIGGVIAPDARSAEAVLRAADHLLYEAKRAGKDAVRLHAA